MQEENMGVFLISKLILGHLEAELKQLTLLTTEAEYLIPLCSYMAQKTATRLGREPKISNSSFSHDQAYNILCLLKEYGNIYMLLLHLVAG